MKFHMTANVEFEADSVENACEVLAQHFRGLGRIDGAVTPRVSGPMEIWPDGMVKRYATDPELLELRREREELRREVENPTPEEQRASAEAAAEVDRLFPRGE